MLNQVNPLKVAQVKTLVLGSSPSIGPVCRTQAFRHHDCVAFLGSVSSYKPFRNQCFVQ